MDSKAPTGVATIDRGKTMDLVIEKARKTKSNGNHLGDAHADGVATDADVALAASLPATARDVAPAVSIGIVNLLRDKALVGSLHANATAIDTYGAGGVDEVLSRIPSFVERYDAMQRLAIAYERVRESLVRDNADFSRFVTAVAKFVRSAGQESPVRKDKALKKLVANRDIQRGLPKQVKTRRKNARAKKNGSAK